MRAIRFFKVHIEYLDSALPWFLTYQIATPKFVGMWTHAEGAYVLLLRFLLHAVLSRSAFYNITSARNDFGYCMSLSPVLKDVFSEQQNAIKKELYSDE